MHFFAFINSAYQYCRLIYIYTPGIYAEGYIVFVFLFVCWSLRMFVSSFVRPSVTFVEFTTKFYIIVSQVGYIWPTTHQKAFIFGPWVTLECLHSCHKFWPQGSDPGLGARGQNLGHLKKCYVAFSLMLIPSNNIMSEIRHPYDLGFVSWGEGQCDLYFMVEWFCLISWRLFDGLMSNIWIMCQCDATFDLKINVSHCDIYFMLQWFLSYIDDYLIYESHTWILFQYDTKIYFIKCM